VHGLIVSQPPLFSRSLRPISTACPHPNNAC
jgi:hypothetical protein